MLQPILDAILDELRPAQVLRDIALHWQCRSTVPSPQLRRAAERLRDRYLENGLPQARVVRYPADDRTETLDGRRNPLEWQPRSAALCAVAPDAWTICRYEDEPLCLVSGSVGTPPDGVEADVVVRSGALAPDAVGKGELAGRILFTDQPPGSVAAAAGKAGAVGIVSDCICPPWLAQHPPVRRAEDAPDLVMWTTLATRRDSPQLWGFNLSARQGGRLRRMLAAGPVRLRAEVDAERLEGASELVDALLPGDGPEEIWVLAHVSEPGARDNASGCSVSLELARVLRVLTESGRLPRLRRGIRFLHAVEVEGFLPYLAERREDWPIVVAGLCVDSVAQDFRACGGEMVLFLSPEENASYIDALCGKLLDTVSHLPADRFSPDPYLTWPWHSEPFWGNDAFIADGYFDIPTPQLSCWPDRAYHSNEDTPEHINAHAVGRAAAMLGGYLYVLATAGAEEAKWLGALAAHDYKHRILDGALEPRDRSPFLALQGRDAVLQAARLAQGDESVRAELEGLADGLLSFAGIEPTQDSSPETGLVMRRLRWQMPELAAEVRAALEGLRRVDGEPFDWRRAWRWINGRRSAAEIRERMAWYGAAELGTVVACLRLFEEAGLVAALPGG
ncbi:MAG: hypothetical protein HYU66_03075 [Armatimonadetes bacterium]|nr:hypothetical protein [Armatimonadota bacterium]